MAEKSNVLEIIQGISQAAANAYDGALDENGEALKTGLQREEGHPILDKRVMDGFGVCFRGNILTVKYQGEISLKEFHRGDFEGDVAQRLQDIASFLKKEYKKVTGNSLSLTKVKDSEPRMLVQSTSRVHSWVEAQQDFTIGGIPSETELGNTVEERLDTSIKNWLGMGKDKFPKTKKPENVSGKRDEEPKKKINEAEEPGLGADKLTKSAEISAQRADIKGATKQSKGVNDKERAIIRQALEILKNYAQTKELTTKVSALKRALLPLQRELKEDSDKN